MTQATFGDVTDISARLRLLRSGNDLTTQQMSDMTGIPKRTLESYMLKNNASLPGIEPLKRLSLGLDVSLDWLVFGGEKPAQDIARLTRVTTRAAVLPILKTIQQIYRRGSASKFETDTILGLSPEDLAVEICSDAGNRAQAIFSQGASNNTVRLVEATQNRRDNI